MQSMRPPVVVASKITIANYTSATERLLNAFICRSERQSVQRSILIIVVLSAQTQHAQSDVLLISLPIFAT
jgi:hypothetical protein